MMGIDRQSSAEVRRKRTWVAFAVALAAFAFVLALWAKSSRPTDLPASRPATIVVLAAASLSEAFTAIGQQFEVEHPGVRALLSFGNSQQLALQLAQGAPGDVLASADVAPMEVAVEAGRVARGGPRVFVRNELVVIYPRDNPANLEKLQDLARPGMRLVLGATETPIGRYSLIFLDKAGQDPAYGAGFEQAVLLNVVSYEQTVKAVLAKIQLGEGDAGIVYISDVIPESIEQVGYLDIPDPLNPVATYLVAPIVDSTQPELAQAFIRLVLSPSGQGILVRHGFLPIE
jgi:molybdate transport system substrate-binding protein